MRRARIASGLVGLAGLVFACGGSTGATSTTAIDGGNEFVDAGNIVDGAADGGDVGGLRTLSSCTTSIAADVPAFYRMFFKCVAVTATNDAVVITSESLPPHRSYYYGSADPNFEAFDTTRGEEYKPNPNTLTKKAVSLTIPNAPVPKGLIVNTALVDGVVATSTEEFSLGPVGVALDSVALFNPLARPGDDIETEKFTFDAYDAHPSPDGAYHYHRASRGPLEVLSAAGLTAKATPGAASVELYGIMCDGTVVLGCTELDGTAPPAASELDAQGGHLADLKDKAGTTYFTNRYHTHVCATGRKYTPEIQYYTACKR